MKKTYNQAAGPHGFIFIAKEALLHPSELFNEVKNVKGIKGDFIYLLKLTILMDLISVLLKTMTPSQSGFNFLTSGLFAVVLALPVSVLSVIGVTFIGTGILHIGVKIMGGKNGIFKTYKAIVYSLTPDRILGLVPISIIAGLTGAVVFGLIILIWVLALEVKGISILQDMSKGRALVALFLPIIFLLGTLLLIGGAAFMLGVMQALG
jgi:hypothetical protein